MENYTDQFVLGVLGGGQLGQMLIRSAIDFNIDVAILDPNPLAPCSNVSDKFTVGSLRNYQTVMDFGRQVDLLTIEIENVNTQALADLEKEGIKICPAPAIIALIQDKRKQKSFYKEHSIPTAPFVLTENKADAIAKITQYPVVHKLGTGGYDGRGVQVIKSSDHLDQLFDEPGLLEEFVPFEKELSVIVARNKSGKTETFPVVEMVFHPEANMVEYLLAPAEIKEEQAQKAREIATDIINKMDMVGLLAVEMFLTKTGDIIVNEVAPRTHNSGHQTIEGNITSQFEQHLRAILNMPLGSTKIRTKSAMLNVLGAEGYEGIAIYKGLEEILKLEGVHIHLYGKKETKPFRKMGHITVLEVEGSKNFEDKINFIKEHLKVIA